MIYFAIPLRSKTTTNNWGKIQTLFNNTIRSIYSQTDPNFKIIVACHEKPEIDFEVDDRLEFIQVDFPSPTKKEEQMPDKFYKKRYIAKRVRELGGGHIMFVDADDLVSNSIAKFVNARPDEGGWYLNFGYEYNQLTHKIQIMPFFHLICGTCAIMKFEVNDLPSDVKFKGFVQEKKYIFDYSHSDWKSVYGIKKTKLKQLPFIGAVYNINTGENVSKVNVENSNGGRKKLQKILPKFNVNRLMSRAFPTLSD